LDKIVNIVGWDNGGGLSRDIDILCSVLKEFGWTAVINGRTARAKNQRLLERVVDRARTQVGKVAVSRRLKTAPYDLNLHLEDVNLLFMPLAKRNVLIPNQEWFRETTLAHLGSMDEVWVKTRLAERIFSNLGCKVRFLGWMGSDRRQVVPSVCKTLAGLHIAGASLWKGTETVLDVWSENSEWPLLRILRRTRGYDGRSIPWCKRASASNIQIITDRVDDEMLKTIQNDVAIHVCPSEAEGFGHTILEAMSVGAVVITSDAPPMNEIVTPKTGLLVAVDRTESMGLGRRYFVSRGDLARTIDKALRMSEEARDSLGRAARASFEANNAAFRVRLQHGLEAVHAEPCPAV